MTTEWPLPGNIRLMTTTSQLSGFSPTGFRLRSERTVSDMESPFNLGSIVREQ